MRRRTPRLTLAGLALLGSLATAAPASSDSLDSFEVRIELAQVQMATARYLWEPNAIADGYIRAGDDECVAVPGLGGMGFHYVNPQRLGRLDPTRPDILLYAPGPHGRRELVAVEYFSADEEPGTDADRPSLFGQAFDGPMPGHTPRMPVHYDLHVWLWRHNPAGMFAPFNPNVSCSVDTSEGDGTFERIQKIIDDIWADFQLEPTAADNLA